MISNINNVIPISSDLDISQEKFGLRASTLSDLFKLGFPVVSGYVISSDLVRAMIDGDPTPEFPTEFLNCSPLCLRASPRFRDWRGPEAMLYLGLNREKSDTIQEQVGKNTGKFIYLEHVRNFAVKVLDLEPELFDEKLHLALTKENAKSARDLPISVIDDLINEFEEYYSRYLGFEFPQDQKIQIHHALKAFVKKWDSPTSKVLRASLGADPGDSMGLILQKMIFANPETQFGLLNIESINENTGEERISGRFFPTRLGEMNSGMVLKDHFEKSVTGEEIMSGEPISILSDVSIIRINELEQRAYQAFGKKLNFSFLIKGEEFFVIDAKDVELQPSALMRLNTQAVRKKLISKETAVLRTDPEVLIDTLHAQIHKDFDVKVIGLGLPASPGAVSGMIAFRAEEAIQMKSKGATVVLVRSETSSEDIRGMHVSSGVLTLRGGMSSHAAVVARGLGKPCVVGVSDLTMDNSLKALTTKEGLALKTGDFITIDGSNGRVLLGQAKMVQPNFSKDFYQIMSWADELGRISIKANADTPQEATLAKEFNVDGIGLCRTEHMFFESKTLLHMQKMILASNVEDVEEAINALLSIQQGKFEEIFKIMTGLPVTIRLFDLPLHEFLPNSLGELENLANELDTKLIQVSERSKQMSEINPMLGKRGVRLGILFPKLYQMQIKAILNASKTIYGSEQINFAPEIMLPMVSCVEEVYIVRDMIDEVVHAVSMQQGQIVKYKLGVMVETPRAALKSGELAAASSFLSFGTNDLTQMTYGLSRDDSGTFMRDYIEQKIYAEDPFRSLDIDGVGELLRIASERSRKSNPNIELGICGEHGGDPNSIDFCNKIGLDFVSCSPYRVPMAKLGSVRPLGL